MADLSDVMLALLQIADSAIYLTGDTGPSDVGGRVVKSYMGWPDANTLNADLALNKSTVSIFPVEGMTQNTTRFQPKWTYTPAAPNLTAVASGNMVTFGGSGDATHVVGLTINGLGYAYRLVLADTPTTVAAAFAIIVPGGTSVAAVLTAPFPVMSAVVVRDVSALAEVSRQKDTFRITIWAPDPAARQAIGTVLRPAFDGLPNGSGGFCNRFTLPDGSVGVIKFVRPAEMDTGQTANVYRRDLIYTVEYPTLFAQTFPIALFGQTNVQIGAGELVTVNLEAINNVALDVNGNVLMTGSGSLLTTI